MYKVLEKKLHGILLLYITVTVCSALERPYDTYYRGTFNKVTELEMMAKLLALVKEKPLQIFVKR